MTLIASSNLGYTPYVVLGGYLVFLLVLGLFSFLKSRGASDAEADYYLAGRGQGILVTSLTIMATYFSGFAILTFPGWVYSHGISPMLYALNLPVAAAAIFIIGNRIRAAGRKHGFITPADMIIHHYGDSRLLRVLVVLTGALYAIPYIIMQVKAGGELAEGLFKDTPPFHLMGMEITIYEAGVFTLALITMLYVLVGGMRSVAWTDVAQGLLLLSAMLVSGLAIFYALDGPGNYFKQVTQLDGEFLTMPAFGQRFNATSALTFCLFASLASVIQPSQWMRFYSARNRDTLRKTSIIFATVLPLCFLVGVFLVGLGGQVLFPTGSEEAAASLARPDQIVILVISQTLPELFSTFGVFVVTLILVAVMAASMSTADSALHALSGIATRDIYKPLRPQSTEAERTWFGRGVIVVATLVSALIAHGLADTPFLSTITQFFFLAMAFSAQLLPITIDMLFLKKGSAPGAVAGLAAGLLTVCLFPGISPLLFGEESGLVQITTQLKSHADVGMYGIVVNVMVFIAVDRIVHVIRKK
ncbi:sodium:solute symporter family protein [Algisphaera agarilytica]|uniref:SSS family solute:Na+ symporter n=1 Tax=Algisphaera agarilytica TaxID=1385975 RepID=A0A7X0HC86_9BACT|nr:sodium:solute symporter family protein [Algisphaera agarilytica]MBB6431710.1 SSS family solute:Na+ symporter [Algisphaera agarilytica]